MRVLVTGGAGFLGSHLCDFLVAKGMDVVCMDNLLTGDTSNIAHIHKENFLFINHDVTNYIYLDGDVDYILHFASPASPIDYLELPKVRQPDIQRARELLKWEPRVPIEEGLQQTYQCMSQRIERNTEHKAR